MKSHRFVVLRHTPGEAGPRELHWDLMLEFGGTLRTWALTKEPSPGNTILADELPAHRKEYLGYEGALSKGRGFVSRFDEGSFEVLMDSPQQLIVQLEGKLLEGCLQLTRDSATQRWTALLTPS